MRQRIPCGYQQTGLRGALGDVSKVPIPRSRTSRTSRQASPSLEVATQSLPTPPSADSVPLAKSSPSSSPPEEQFVLRAGQLGYQDLQFRGVSTLGSLDNCLFYYYLHWCSLPSDLDSSVILFNVLPRLARGHPFLMDATLAFAAASLRISCPGNPVFVRASHGYLARSIAKQTKELTGGITKTNFEGLYLTACLIAMHTLFQRRYASIRFDEDSSVAEWFYAFRGLRAITLAKPGLYLDSSVACSFPPGGWQNPFKNDVDCLAIHPDLGFMLEALEEEHRAGALDFESHRHALGYLSQILWCPSRPLCVRFLVEARQPFIDSVARREHMALLITGVYLSNIQFLQGLEALVPSAEHDWGQIARFIRPAYRDLLYRGMEVVTNCHV